MVPVRVLTGLLLLFCIMSEFVNINALSCPSCKRSECKPPEGCKHGLVGDLCGCCDRCAKGLGEECGGIWTQDGRCGKDMGCSTTRMSQRKGKCVPESEAAEVLK